MLRQEPAGWAAPQSPRRQAQRGEPPLLLAPGGFREALGDYPNQVNNVLGFPFIFRGALDVRARAINHAMMVSAARALADLATPGVTDTIA
jgi:hypothetical protein